MAECGGGGRTCGPMERFSIEPPLAIILLKSPYVRLPSLPIVAIPSPRPPHSDAVSSC